MITNKQLESLVNTLRSGVGWSSMRRVALIVGVSPRSLRSTKKGRALDAARALIFRQTGKIVVTSTSRGVLVTDDVGVVEHCAKELHAHAMGELKTAARLERMLALKETGQHELFEDTNDDNIT